MIRECEKCNAILEFQSDRVLSICNKFENMEYIVCPNCGKKVCVINRKANK